MNKEPLLITGISSGVGLSLARHLARNYQIVGIARKVDVAREALADLPDVDVFQADLRHPAEIDACLDTIFQNKGIPKMVINNAGMNIANTIHAPTTLDEMRDSMQVNCLAPLAIMQRVLPAMIEDNFGRIVNITSGAPLNCFPGYASYSASKGALNAMTVTAAQEQSDRNIRINLMSPGPVRSNMAPDAEMDPSVCHPTMDYLLNMDSTGPTGKFFWLGYEIPLFPDLSGIQWLEGKAPDHYRRVV